MTAEAKGIAVIYVWTALLGAMVRVAFNCLWFAPFTFRNTWISAARYSSQDLKQTFWRSFFWMVILSLMMSAFLVGMISALGKTSWLSGLAAAGLLWIGIVMPTQLSELVWNKKNTTLCLLDAGSDFTSFLGMGVVIGVVL
ncbi:DUF1761 domain-containing protein [Mycobacterium simiae]|nr:DUF1761 domain-containing protein [Mycobacterium simiae]